MKLSNKTPLAKILQEIPQAREVLKKFNLDCAGCLGANSEDLETIARSNGIKVNDLLNELEKLDTSN